MSEFQRELPRNNEAECAVLGSLLADNEGFFRILGRVDVEDFASERHQLIFRTIAGLIRSQKPADLLTVKEELNRTGMLDEAGGSAYVSGLVDSIPDFSSLVTYADIVAEHSRRRQMIRTFHDATEKAFAGKDDVQTLASDVSAKLSGVAVPQDRESRPLCDIVAEVHDQADQRARDGHSLAITTGFPSLDRCYAIRRKSLTAAAAPSGQGKSALLLNVALGVVRNSNEAVVNFYSLEMSGQEVSDRVIAILSGVNHSRIKEWKHLSEFERRSVNEAKESLRAYRQRLFFADRIRTVDQIFADSRRRKMASGRLDVVAVDYLQLIRGEDERTREREVNVIALRLFELSQELDCAVVAASQVNKDRTRRSSGRLHISDLKEASAIGEHAGVVIMFQRPWEDEKSNAELQPCKVLMQLEKNREGESGDFDMHFSPSTQTFGEGGCEENNCRGVGRARRWA